VVAAVPVILLVLSERGRFGRRIEAVREDPELAASTGTNVLCYRRLAFLASGILGGTAGALNVLLRTTVSPPDIDFSLIVLALTIIVIGGARSWTGALIGAVIFTWLPSVLAFVGEWQSLFYSGLVALAAIYVPGGLVGVAIDGYHGWQRRGAVTRREASATARAAIAGGISSDRQGLEHTVPSTPAETHLDERP
jgi:branched-chain amino acid transport system permease protein